MPYSIYRLERTFTVSTPKAMSPAEFEDYLTGATRLLAEGWAILGNRPLTPHEQELLKARLWSYYDIHRQDEMP